MLETFNTCIVAIDMQEKLMPAICGHEEIVKKTAALIRGARLLGVPALATQQYTKGLGPTVVRVADALGDFEPVEKMAFSCMADSGFAERLAEMDAENVVVVGAEAHICVMQTVLDMLDGEHYEVHIVTDCLGSRREGDMRAAIKRMANFGAVATTAETVLFELMRTAEHPCRKEIQRLVLGL